MTAAAQLVFIVGLSIALGTVVTAWHSGWPLRRVLALTAGPTIAALLGMRVLFVLLHPELGTAPLDWINIFAGNHAPGGVLGVGVYFLVQGPTTRALADRVAISIALAMTVARVGCVLNGCCQPIAMPYVGLGLGMIALAVVRYPRRSYDGQVLLEVMLVYFAGSALLEGYRSMPTYWGTVPELQFVNAILALVAGTGLLWQSLRFAMGRTAALRLQ